MLRHMAALLIAGTANVAGVGLTAEQQQWYGTCMASSERMPKMDDIFNTMCTCKQNPSVVVGSLTVDPVCLTPGYAPPQGGIQGGLGGRIAWTLASENACTGTAFTMYPTAVPGEPGALIFSWMEDFNASTTERGAHSRLTKVARSEVTGRYEVVADITLPQCAQSGGTVFNKRGDIATLCFAVCEDCAEGTERLEPFLVEVKADLSHIIRRGSVMSSTCAEHNTYCYPRGRGTILQDLSYDPKRDWYAVWLSGGIDHHVGDMLPLIDADPSLDFPRIVASKVPGSCGRAGWSWESIKGHTTGHRIAYHPQFETFGVLVTSDLPRTTGLRYKAGIGYYQRSMIAGNENVGQASVTWPGAILACGCHFYSAWHGVEKMGDYSREKKVQLGFGRFTPDGQRVYVKWIALPDGVIPKSVRLAVLGGGEADGCNRFLLGWGEMQKDALYPERYMLAEVDSEGEMLTEPLDVTAATYWGEDEPWVTHANGDVTWVSTWRRNNDGSPNHIGQDPVTGQVREAGPQSCTYKGRNDGYGHNVIRAYTDTQQFPYWCKQDAEGNYPSWCKIWDWGTTGFKTNEMFVNRVSAAQRVAELTWIGWMVAHMTPARVEHPECARDDVLQKNEYCMGASVPLPETPAPPATPAPAAVPAGPMPPAPVVPAVPAQCEEMDGFNGLLDYPAGTGYYEDNTEACWNFACPDVSEGIKLAWLRCDTMSNHMRFEYLDTTRWHHFVNDTAPSYPDDYDCEELITNTYNRLSILFSSGTDRGRGIEVAWECLMPVTPTPPTAVPTGAPPTALPTVVPTTSAPDTTVPATTAPDTSAPATSAPATSAPDTSAPDTSAPRTSAPATSAPVTSAPATTAPDTSAPDTSAPATSAPPTPAPATSAPATSAPATSAPPTAAPATSAPATSAPATSAPATSAPATSAPATSAPATSAPATSAPATSAPATSAPATSAPATSAPATSAPATSAPATSAPATSAPATSAPATSAPATSAPATSAPATSAPATSAPATSAPATSAPATSAPATSAPATSAPATSAPATSAPATSAPATSAPATSAPATSAPATSAPATSAPATSAPATSAPATSAPATSAPATSAPATSAPATSAHATSAPATSAPATSAPATSAPATSAPATSAPATSAPATSAPATSAPATSAPPTAAPATSAPATSAPATSAPTTSAPVTSASPTSAPATSAPATSAPDTSAPATPEPSTGIPTPTVCKDKNLADGNLWVDSRGTIGKNKHSCRWYRRRTRCARHGATYAREDMTANEACCVCGGGMWM